MTSEKARAGFKIGLLAVALAGLAAGIGLGLAGKADRTNGVDRLANEPERLIETTAEFRTETRGQWSPWLRQQVDGCVEAECTKSANCVVGQA